MCQMTWNVGIGLQLTKEAEYFESEAEAPLPVRFRRSHCRVPPCRDRAEGTDAAST